MPQIYRVSLVKMIYAKYPKSKTPSPFMEMRAFVFLTDMPVGIRLQNLRRSLNSATKEMMDKILPHIFKDNEGNYDFIFQEPRAMISVKTLTRFFKVEIDGLEVEPIDVDEIITERLFWIIKGTRMPVDHHLFLEKRIEGANKLRLRTMRIYRYMAFFDEDGNIKGEYDEIDISRMLHQLSLIERRSQLIRRMFSQVTDTLSKVTSEIEKSISDLEKIAKKFKV